MTTDEIIHRLQEVKAVYGIDTCFSAETVAADQEALTAAIQAVKLLEQIKQDMHGYCEACKHEGKHTYEPPCVNCAAGCYPSDDNSDRWEFRWPLGKEADHETH